MLRGSQSHIDSLSLFLARTSPTLFTLVFLLLIGHLSDLCEARLCVLNHTYFPLWCRIPVDWAIAILSEQDRADFMDTIRGKGSFCEKWLKLSRLNFLKRWHNEPRKSLL